MAILNRPMFNDQAQNSGIVSTVADVPSAPVNPELETQLTTDLQQEVDTAMNQEIAATSAQLDSAESVDDMLAAMGGTATNTEQARTELAALVGEQDAQATPESVLPITQTTLQLIQSVESTNGQGGLGSLLGDPGDLTAQTMGTAVGDPTSPVAAPTMPMPADFNPMVGFNLGGFNDLNPMGTNPIYGNINANNPLLTPIGKTPPVGSSAAVDAAQRQAVDAAQLGPITPITDPDILPLYRGQVDVRNIPAGSYASDKDIYDGMDRAETLWDIDFGKTPEIKMQDIQDYAKQYRGTLSDALPKVESVDARVDRRLGQLTDYLPERKTPEQIIQEQKQLMGDYLVENPDYEQVLAEYQGDYGDIQKDIETQSWLELAKFGGAIATSSKNPFYAMAQAIPGLADGIGALAKEKSAIDRQIRVNARGEYKRLEDLRNQQQMAMAQGAYEQAEALQSEYNTIQLNLRSAAIEAFEEDKSQDELRQYELMSGSLNWGQVLAQLGAEAEGVNARHRDDVLQSYATTPVEYFMYTDSENKRRYGAGRMHPYGLFGLDGNYIRDAQDITPIDADAYARGQTGTSTPEYTRTNFVLFDEQGNPQQVTGFADTANALYYTSTGPDGGLELLDSNKQDWTMGTLADFEEVAVRDNVVSIVNKNTGKAHVVRFTNPETNEVLTLNAPEELGVDSSHPLAKLNGAPAIDWDYMAVHGQASLRSRMLTGVMDYENAVREFMSFMERSGFESATGPAASVQMFMNNAAAFIPDDSRWNDWIQNMGTEQMATEWTRLVEILVRAAVPSMRYPEGQVQYVRNVLGEAPAQFFRNPEAARARMLEILRGLQNDYSRSVAELTGQPYYSMEVAPSGGIRDPFRLDIGEHRNYIDMIRNSNNHHNASQLEDKWGFYPVPEGKEKEVEEKLKQRDPENPDLPYYGIEYSEPTEQVGRRGIWFRYGDAGRLTDEARTQFPFRKTD
jgi:hypothetical protein